MHPLSIHQVTVPDAHPRELIRIAHALDCEHVCLFTQGFGAQFPFHVVQDDEVDELLSLRDELGVSVLGTTSFALTPTTNVATLGGGLERSERLGSKLGNARFVDDDHARVVDNFARLAELASHHGVELSIEFTGFGDTAALARALDVIRQAGRGKITLDPLHIVRTGTTLEALRQLEPGTIGYAQFCDGSLQGSAETYGSEGGKERLPPGDGEFPLAEMLTLVPPGMPISLEVPQESQRLRGVSAMERCRRAVDGMRRLDQGADTRN